MVFLSVGSIKPILLEVRNREDILYVRKTLPVFFPFIFIYFIFQNYRILLAPLDPSLGIVAKVTLKNIVQARFHLSTNSIFKLFFVHLVVLPRDCTIPIQLRACDPKLEMWISRHALVQGFGNGNFTSGLEEDLKRCFWTSSVQLWGRAISGSSVPIVNLLKIRSTIQLEQISEIDKLIPGQINFVDFPNATVVNGCYAIDGMHYIKNLPYEVGGMNSFPQRDLLVGSKGMFRQSGEVIANHYEGLFLGSSSNWYHFLVEVLPRGIEWSQTHKKRIGVVFNRDTPKSILEIIEKIGRSQPILISDGEVVTFKNLTVALDGRYAHQADVTRIVPGINIFKHRRPDFQIIQAWMKENFTSSDHRSPKKILLVRGLNKSRPLHNALEIQQVLEEIGFVAIDPELLSIENQIKTFENAEVMVAEEGAALTNLIFAEKMKLVILMGSNPHPQFGAFWRQFAGVLNIQSVRILGTPQKRNRTGDGRYSVDITELIHLVRTASEGQDFSVN
jgi:hypothetical protein